MDRQQLAEALQAGLSPVAHSSISPNEPEYKAIEGSIVTYDYDPRRAVQLIEGLGYTRGADGLYRDGAQQRLSLKIQTTIDDLREKMILIIGNYWEQVGIGTEPVIIPRQASADRQIRATFAAFDTSRPDPHPTRFHSSSIPLPENGFRGNNRSRYTSHELDALIEKYFVTIPRDERSQILGQMVRHVTDQLVFIGIFFLVEPALINNRVMNVLPRKGEDALHTWNAHEWDVKS